MFIDIIARKLFDKYTENNFLGENSIVEIQDFIYMGQCFYAIATMYIDPFFRQCSVSDLIIKTGDEFDEDVLINFTKTELEKKIESFVVCNNVRRLRAKRLNISI